MPEGDTIHRAARRVGAVLVGRPLTEIAMPRVAGRLPQPGTSATRVEARGKHLLVHLDDGHVIHTHLRLGGAWRTRPQPARRPPRSVLRVWLATESDVAACTDAPVAELLDEAAVARHPVLRRLGPDLCVTGVDVDEVVARAQRSESADRPLVDLLLDQRVAAGIGNVIKAEALFVAGLDPRRRVADTHGDQLRDLFTSAAQLLQDNVERPRRTTVPGAAPGSLWVYGRAGRGCRRCGTTLVEERLGRDLRTTTWCPSCQQP